MQSGWGRQMVPNSLGSSACGLPVVGTHLKRQQVGMCEEASGGLMCRREKLEILTGSAGTSFVKVFVVYLKPGTGCPGWCGGSVGILAGSQKLAGQGFQQPALLSLLGAGRLD